MELGACRAVKRESREHSHIPTATAWLQNMGSRKRNRKLSRHQFGLKNLFQTKNSPPKSFCTKRVETKRVVITKVFTDRKDSSEQPQHRAQGTLALVVHSQELSQ